MRWKLGRRSHNVEDRRGRPGLRLPISPRLARRLVSRRGGIGGGIGLIALVLIVMVFGADLGLLFDDVRPSQAPGSQDGSGSPAEDQLADFVAVVLADTEDTWRTMFDRLGHEYQDPTLVLFSGAVDSACGFARAASGPFYCPADRKLYIDLSFYTDLRDRYGAPGDFAQAYVIAHEIGHHVQTLFGVSKEVEAARQQVGQAQANQLSIMLELQADCFAGVWAYHAGRAGDLLEEGDLEEGIRAASAIGDDRLQQRSQGYVVPETFTHGSAEQRVRWLRRGLAAGDVAACDTFNVDRL